MSEQVNHPEHYNQYPVEVIEMMQRIWGIENTIIFCQMNAFKYRMRAGSKGDIAEDLNKEKWYLSLAKQLAEQAALDQPQQ